MNFDLQIISFIVLSIISPSWMFSSGPPDEIWAKEKNKPTKNTCLLMNPSVSDTHKGGEQQTEVPFEIKSNKKKARAGEIISINIKPKKGSFDVTEFKGFLVQGVDQLSQKIVGLFDVGDDDPKIKRMTCDGSLGSAVSHKNPELKSEVSLKWRVPSLGNQTTVQFSATIVASKHKFWVKNTSVLVNIENMPIEEPTEPQLGSSSSEHTEPQLGSSSTDATLHTESQLGSLPSDANLCMYQSWLLAISFIVGTACVVVS